MRTIPTLAFLALASGCGPSALPLPPSSPSSSESFVLLHDVRGDFRMEAHPFGLAWLTGLQVADATCRNLFGGHVPNSGDYRVAIAAGWPDMEAPDDDEWYIDVHPTGPADVGVYSPSDHGFLYAADVAPNNIYRCVVEVR